MVKSSTDFQKHVSVPQYLDAEVIFTPYNWTDVFTTYNWSPLTAPSVTVTTVSFQPLQVGIPCEIGLYSYLW